MNLSARAKQSSFVCILVVISGNWFQPLLTCAAKRGRLVVFHVMCLVSGNGARPSLMSTHRVNDGTEDSIFSITLLVRVTLLGRLEVTFFAVLLLSVWFSSDEEREDANRKTIKESSLIVAGEMTLDAVRVPIVMPMRRNAPTIAIVPRGRLERRLKKTPVGAGEG